MRNVPSAGDSLVAEDALARFADELVESLLQPFEDFVVALFHDGAGEALEFLAPLTDDFGQHLAGRVEGKMLEDGQKVRIPRLEQRFNGRIDDLLKQEGGGGLVERPEVRVYAGLYREAVKQPGAEAVNGVDRRHVHVPVAGPPALQEKRVAGGAPW